VRRSRLPCARERAARRFDSATRGLPQTRSRRGSLRRACASRVAQARSIERRTGLTELIFRGTRARSAPSSPACKGLDFCAPCAVPRLGLCCSSARHAARRRHP
jgi:hypothetical protein